MVDPSIGWLEIVQYNDDKQADTISNLVAQAFLCIYPRPTITTHTRRNVFLFRVFLSLSL